MRPSRGAKNAFADVVVEFAEAPLGRLHAAKRAVPVEGKHRKRQTGYDQRASNAHLELRGIS